MKINKEEIKKVLPHREPFLLVDEIIEFKEGEYSIGKKYIDPDDSVFKGHFPNNEVYPGVLLIETMAQVGAYAILSEENNKGAIAYFTGIKNAKFRKMVLPGDEVIINCNLTNMRRNIGFAEAKAYVKDKLVCQCVLSFAISDHRNLLL